MNKKGFTLIELLAVIVIVGILMSVAVLAVTRYIDNSKKEAYIKQINSLVDTVRYGINSGDNNYSMVGKSSRMFDLKDVVLEKGGKTVIEGQLVVSKSKDAYKYYVLVSKEENNNCIALIDINNLSKESIVDCATMEDVEFSIGKKIWFSGSFWYVINNSKYSDSYVTLLKDSESGYMEYGSTGIYDDSLVKEFLNTEELNRLGSENLVDVDGYKIRLITDKELKNIGCNINNEHYGNCSNSEYSWISLKDETYYCMPPNGVSDQYIGIVNANGEVSGWAAYYQNSYAVRPVINLLKTTIREDIAKKEKYIANVNGFIDIVKNGLNDSNSKYYMDNANFKWFSLDDISDESNTIKNGFVQVVKEEGYKYKVRVTDEENNYCFKSTDITTLKYEDIVSCSSLKNEIEYKNSDVLTYNNQSWYIIEDSYYNDDYVKLLKADVLTAGELGPNATVNNCTSSLVNNNYYGCKSTSDKYATIRYSNSTSRNSYNNSLINTVLTTYYLPILGENNLALVDGYKVKEMDISNCDLLKNHYRLGDYWTSNSASSGKAYTCCVYKETWGGSGFSFYYAKKYETALTQYRTVLPMINLKKAAIQ